MPHPLDDLLKQIRVSRHEPYRVTPRDQVAVWLTKMALRLATDHYRAFIRGVIEYGMRAAAQDEQEGRPYPPDWRPQT